MLPVLILVLVGASQICQAVLNGRPAGYGEYPYAVALFYEDHFLCTGSIICENKILTAGHCAEKNGTEKQANKFYGIIGSVKKSAGGERIEFEKVQHHPQFQRFPFLYDLSIFTTKKPITFTKYIRAVCLAKEDTKYGTYDVGVAMGWGDVLKSSHGHQHDHFGSPDHMQFVKQKVLNYEKCKKVLTEDYELPENMTETQLCTTEYETDKIEATCKGDSGGPLVYRHDQGENENDDVQSPVQDIQIGITSTGSHHCGQWPTASTRVASFIDFIQKETEGCKLCFL